MKAIGASRAKLSPQLIGRSWRLYSESRGIDLWRELESGCSDL